MLMDHRASEGKIRDYLDEAATEHMGLSPHAGLVERCATAAAVLVGLRPEFETH